MNADLEGPIVVGVDDSPHGQLALHWAVGEAALRDLDVRVLRAAEEPTVRWAAAGMDGISAAPPADDHRAKLDAAVEYATDRLGPSRARGVLVPGPAGRAILDEAAGAALVVVGSGAHSAAGAVMLGSVASVVAAHAACPAVVVRGSAWESDSGSVLVGVDGSSLSDRAVAVAFDEAERRGAQLQVVHVWHPLDHIAADRWSEAAMQEQHSRARAWLEECVAGYREEYPAVDVRLAVLEGRAAATLVELSEHSALVVVGTRGHDGIAGLLLGSVSQNLLHHAHCPIAVVRNRI